MILLLACTLYLIAASSLGRGWKTGVARRYCITMKIIERADEQSVNRRNARCKQAAASLRHTSWYGRTVLHCIAHRGSMVTLLYSLSADALQLIVTVHGGGLEGLRPSKNPSFSPRLGCYAAQTRRKRSLAGAYGPRNPRASTPGERLQLIRWLLVSRRSCCTAL